MSNRARSETLLQILTRCVGGFDSEPGRMLARVWALELRIAADTGREAPRDMFIVCAAFEAREKALREELSSLPSVIGQSRGAAPRHNEEEE